MPQSGTQTDGSRLLDMLDASRGHPFRVFAVIAGAQAVILIGLGTHLDVRYVFGLPGSVAALAAVFAGALAGPLVGALTALAGGLVFWIWVTDQGRFSTAPTAVADVLLWLAVGVAAGLLASALREREARRRLAARDLAVSRETVRAQAEAALLHSSLVRSLAPTSPPRHPLLQVSSVYRPAEDRLQLGGDFLDWVTCDNGEFAMIIGDVMGHSPQAAALGARLRAAWEGMTLAGDDLATVADSLNRMVALADPEAHVTAFLARLDPELQTASWVSAGHPAPLLAVDGRTVPLKLRPALPFGVFEDASYLPQTVELPSGFSLLFYTDGLVEARYGDGSHERFGEQRLRQRAEQLRAFDDEALDGLLADIAGETNHAFDDDLAVLLIASRDGRAGVTHQPGTLADFRRGAA